MDKIFGFLQNKYLLVTIAFVIWMMFFDRNDLMSQYDYSSQVSQLEEERDFYIKETNQVRQDLDELTTNQTHLETFAREKYLMKKDNEDVYVIVRDSSAVK